MAALEHPEDPYNDHEMASAHSMNDLYEEDEDQDFLTQEEIESTSEEDTDDTNQITGQAFLEMREEDAMKNTQQSNSKTIQDTENVFMRPTAEDNKLTREIYRSLLRQYLREKNNWDPDTLREFKETAPLTDYTISRSTGIMASNRIQKSMLENATWTGFFFLRVMFGPNRCAKQSWFPDFVEQYPMARQNAPAGRIPPWYTTIINDETPGEWEPISPSLEYCNYNAAKARQRQAKLNQKRLAQKEAKKQAKAEQKKQKPQKPQKPVLPTNTNKFMTTTTAPATQGQAPTTQSQAPARASHWFDAFKAKQPNTATMKPVPSQATATITALQQDIKQARQDVTKLEQQLRTQTKQNEAHEETIKKLSKDNERLVSSNESLKSTLALTNVRITEYDGIMQVLASRIMALENVAQQ
jgi:hypothetical protein